MKKYDFLMNPYVSRKLQSHDYQVFACFNKNLSLERFDKIIFTNKYIDFLIDLNKQISFFKNAVWAISDFNLDDPVKEQPELLLEAKNQEVYDLIEIYNDIDSVFMTPLTRDLNQIEKDGDQFYHFKFENSLNDKYLSSFYTNLRFTFSEQYSSVIHRLDPITLENLMKFIVFYWKDYSGGIKYIALSDSDFTSRNVPDDSSYYKHTYQVYPHRLEYAWCCIVQGNFTKADIPQAERVENFSDGYTFISTIKQEDYFSSYNADHVYKANLIEIRLQELGLLPYFKADELLSE